jgi:hypothetical protein
MAKRISILGEVDLQALEAKGRCFYCDKLLSEGWELKGVVDDPKTGLHLLCDECYTWGEAYWRRDIGYLDQDSP